jgi:transcriptional regulator with XRE-family HTH domain
VEAAACQGVEMDRLANEGVPVVPSPETIAFFIRWQRGVMGWKRETLAAFASVSLSTIERIERGDPVSAGSLDRVAEALRQPPGAFTAARIPLTSEAAWQKLDESAAPFADTVAVPVRPLRGHRQIAELARTHLFIVDANRLDDTCAADIDNLREWLDLASFLLVSEDKDSILQTDAEPVKRRELYEDILGCVRGIERRGHAVALAGTYQAETGAAVMPKADIALIGFFPKLSDPAAHKRQALFAPARVDLAAVWQRFCTEGK